MATLDIGLVRQFVAENMGMFHTARLEGVRGLELRKVLRRKNPYLFRAKNITNAPLLVDSILEALLPASEEERFGHFLEDLAIFVCRIAYGGQKSSTTGIDLEFIRDDVRYVVAIKSGPNWGNSSQHKKLQDNFRNALRVLRQSPQVRHARAVLGTCYGRCRVQDDGQYLKLCGQPFWEFISGEPNLYIDIVEPIGHAAKEHNENFRAECDRVRNRLTREFMIEFCTPDGEIDWEKLLRFNSGPDEG